MRVESTVKLRTRVERRTLPGFFPRSQGTNKNECLKFEATSNDFERFQATSTIEQREWRVSFFSSEIALFLEAIPVKGDLVNGRSLS